MGNRNSEEKKLPVDDIKMISGSRIRYQRDGISVWFMGKFYKLSDLNSKIPYGDGTSTWTYNNLNYLFNGNHENKKFLDGYLHLRYGIIEIKEGDIININDDLSIERKVSIKFANKNLQYMNVNITDRNYEGRLDKGIFYTFISENILSIWESKNVDRYFQGSSPAGLFLEMNEEEAEMMREWIDDPKKKRLSFNNYSGNGKVVIEAQRYFQDMFLEGVIVDGSFVNGILHLSPTRKYEGSLEYKLSDTKYPVCNGEGVLTYDSSRGKVICRGIFDNDSFVQGELKMERGETHRGSFRCEDIRSCDPKLNGNDCAIYDEKGRLLQKGIFNNGKLEKGIIKIWDDRNIPVTMTTSGDIVEDHSARIASLEDKMMTLVEEIGGLEEK